MSESKALYWMIGGIILGLLLLLSIRSYLPERTYPTIEYNNFIFEKIEGNWYFDWQQDNRLYTVSLRYNPLEVENVPIRGVLNKTFNQRREVYITFDPELGEHSKNFTTLALAATELSSSIARVLGFKPISACTSNHTTCIGAEIVTCESANKNNQTAIYLTDSGDAGIILDQNCITLHGEGFALLKSVDRLLYQWYGIMGERWAQ